MKIEGTQFYMNNNGLKLGYFGFGRSPGGVANEGILILEGAGSQHYYDNAFALHYYFGGHINPTVQINQKQGTGKPITVGSWHQIEVEQRLNTLGQSDGVLRIWVDGVNVISRTDMTFVTSSNAAGFNSWRWEPTWGGGLTPHVGTDYISLDHVYLSGIPLGSTPTPSPVPVVSLSASPASITSGGSSTLSWSTTNATSCTASGGTFTGAKATSGTQVVTPTTSTTYTLTCTGVGGSGSASATVSVSTVTPPPTVNKFKVGDRVQVSGANLNVRQTPSTSGALLGTQNIGALGTVTAGPTTATGYTWWNINYDSGADGWSIEDNLTITTTPTPALASHLRAAPAA
jgi:hypothetical protein